MFGLFKPKKVAADLSFIGVDMHSHLLPALDDGSKSMEETLLFISELQALGYKKLICTPHILSSVHLNSPETILPKLAEVQAAVQAAGINIEIAAAAEYMIDYEFEQLITKGEPLLTFGKNYILVEMSYLAPSPNFEQVIFDLRVKGLQPIIAHPERYNYYHRMLGKYQNFKDMGCLLQVNLLSLSGYYGKPIKKVAEHLIEAGLIDFIGTDLHHENHLNMLKGFTTHKDFYTIAAKANFKNLSLL